MAREVVIARAGACPGLSLWELFEKTTGIATRDDIHALIAAGEIYVDLYSKPLTDPETVSVLRNEAEAEPGSTRPSDA